jgi:hypothetical protein
VAAAALRLRQSLRITGHRRLRVQFEGTCGLWGIDTKGYRDTHRYNGKHWHVTACAGSSDIHLLKAELYEAVQLPGHALLVSDDANLNAPEWVTYQYRRAYPILCHWLPSKLAEWLA